MSIRKRLDHVLAHVVDACAAVSETAYRGMSVHTWRSTDGRITPITQMDDRWLANAIGACERNPGENRTRVLPHLRAELARRQAALRERRTGVRPVAFNNWHLEPDGRTPSDGPWSAVEAHRCIAEMHARLKQVEAVAHKPQPVLTLRDLYDAIERTISTHPDPKRSYSVARPLRALRDTLVDMLQEGK